MDNNDLTVYFRGINLIYAENDGEQTYYHFNAHGDVIALTNADGEKVKTYAYDAFGEEHDISALDENPFRYCGEYYDTVSGTIYLRARYYDPALGRFTQQDGWEFAEPEDPLSLNLYTYCWNNPIKWYDPTGTRLSSTEIHNSVIKDIASNDSNIKYEKTYIKYKTVVTTNKKKYSYGYCDFYKTDTGEIWEVKRFNGGATCSMINARIQLGYYVNNGYLAYAEDLELKFGGTETPIAANAFFLEDKDGEGGYWVSYWDTSCGIIFYDYIYLASKNDILITTTVVSIGILLGYAWSLGIPIPPPVPVGA